MSDWVGGSFVGVGKKSSSFGRRFRIHMIIWMPRTHISKGLLHCWGISFEDVVGILYPKQ